MISYNPKEWFTFIFKFHKADTFRTLLPLIIGISIYSGIIVYFIQDYFHLADNHHLKNITIMHSMLGFVISLLLVFRTNTAYDRWWEGRKQWGALVNNSRNLALKLSAILVEKEDKIFFKKIIPYYANVLNLHLKNQNISQELFDEYNINIDHKKHKPNQVAKLLFKKINDLYHDKKITGIFQPHLYTRTRDFADGFAQSLSLLDALILLDIYPAREKPIKGVDAQMILDKVTISDKQICSKADLLAMIKMRQPEVILTLGAGDIDQLVQPIKTLLA